MDVTFFDKLEHLWPEITVLIGACLCLVAGLSDKQAIRKATPFAAMLSLAIAAVVQLVFGHPDEKHFMGLGAMAGYLKLAILGIGLLLVMIATGAVDQIKQIIDAESREGSAFDPGEDFRGEFFAFMLFSLAGVMLTAGASDLVWLFLALELTSLPTYVLVATSRQSPAAQESAVKYFFLGALSAAVFLYGFALIYGATGYTEFGKIAAHTVQYGASPMLILGVALAVAGVCFKIAAVPMHFYTADVYQGAATPVTAFLAFVPKTAGVIALIAILGLPLENIGGVMRMPEPLVYLIAIIAAVTMTVGNALGLIQSNLKRVMAYSSIAHSGYLLIGILVGPMLARAIVTQAQAAGKIEIDTSLSNGTAAVLFYLIAYGLSTIGVFAVLASVTRRDGGEVESYDDLGGMRTRHPYLAGVLLVSVISLVGLPPLVGFLGKFYLINSTFAASSIDAEHAGLYRGLVVLLILNSAMSAGYYLRIIGAAFFGEDTGQTVATAPLPRRIGGVLAALASIAFGGYPAAGYLAKAAKEAAEQPPSQTTQTTEMQTTSIEASSSRDASLR